MSEHLHHIVRQTLADVLGLDVSVVDDDTSMDGVQDWDSANHISLVLALEDELNLSFDISEIEEMTSVYDIISVIEQKY